MVEASITHLLSNHREGKITFSATRIVYGACRIHHQNLIMDPCFEVQMLTWTSGVQYVVSAMK